MDTVKINSAGVKMVAHRGVSGIERENTNAAFLAAGNRSYFGVETDVHVTKDGKFVIIHDETTDRVTLGEHKINVEESDYREVENIILPDKDGSKVRGDIKIPLLGEYISICKKYGKVCVLEVKNHFTEENLKKMVKEIEALGYIDNVIFISFDMANCVTLRKILPDNEIQWLSGIDWVTEEVLKTLGDNRLDVDLQYTGLTKEHIEMFHSKGMKVNCWTCDNKEDAEKLILIGVDFITTNILE